MERIEAKKENREKERKCKRNKDREIYQEGPKYSQKETNIKREDDCKKERKIKKKRRKQRVKKREKKKNQRQTNELEKDRKHKKREVEYVKWNTFWNWYVSTSKWLGYHKNSVANF